MGLFARVPEGELTFAWGEDEIDRTHGFAFHATRESAETWDEWDAAVNWCVEHFGVDRARWVESPNSVFMCFRDEIDAFEFRMRWC